MAWTVMPAKGEDGTEGLWIMDSAGNTVCDLYTEKERKDGRAWGIHPFPNAEQNAKRICDTHNERLIKLHKRPGLLARLFGMG